MIYILIFLLFIFVQNISNYYIFENKSISYENNITLNVKDKLNTMISNKFNQIESIKAYLERHKNIKDKNDLENILSDIQTMKSFPYIIIGTLDKNFYISEDNFHIPDNYDPTKRSWFIETINANKTIVTSNYKSLRLNLPAVSICTPINILKQSGVLCGGQPLLIIEEYLKTYDRALYLFENDTLLATSTKDKEFLFDKNKYNLIKIDNTNWSFLLQNDKTTYHNKTLYKLILINIIIVGTFLLFFIYVNKYYIKLNWKFEKNIIEQRDFLNEYMLKHERNAFILYDEETNIVSLNELANKISDNYLPNKDIFSFFENSENIKKPCKTAIKEAIIKSANEKILQFITYKDKFNKIYYLTINPVLLEVDKYGFFLSIQDITDMQNTDDTTTDVENKFFNSYIEKLLFHIENNIDDEDLNIDKLSTVSGYSKFHLQRIFKQYMNTTIGNYIKTKRLQKSLFLLKYSNQNINTIGKICGFSYSQSFTRFFEKELNQAPLSYRNELIKKHNESLLLPLNEQSIIELEEFSILYLDYDNSKNNSLEIKESLVKHFPNTFDENYSQLLMYTNLTKPNKLCFLLKNKINAKENMPIYTFPKSKWIKLIFNPSEHNIEDFLEKIFYTYYLNKLYTQFVPVLKFDKHLLIQEETISEIFIKID